MVILKHKTYFDKAQNEWKIDRIHVPAIELAKCS